MRRMNDPIDYIETTVRSILVISIIKWMYYTVIDNRIFDGVYASIEFHIVLCDFFEHISYLYRFGSKEIGWSENIASVNSKIQINFAHTS